MQFPYGSRARALSCARSGSGEASAFAILGLSGRVFTAHRERRQSEPGLFPCVDFVPPVYRREMIQTASGGFRCPEHQKTAGVERAMKNQQDLGLPLRLQIGEQISASGPIHSREPPVL